MDTHKLKYRVNERNVKGVGAGATRVKLIVLNQVTTNNAFKILFGFHYFNNQTMFFCIFVIRFCRFKTTYIGLLILCPNTFNKHKKRYQVIIFFSDRKED